MGKPDIGDNERHLCPLMIVGNTSMVNLMEKKIKNLGKVQVKKKILFIFTSCLNFCIVCYAGNKSDSFVKCRETTCNIPCNHCADTLSASVSALSVAMPSNVSKKCFHLLR